MAMTSYNDIDFEADDFTLPPQVDTNFTVPSRLVSTTATNGPTLPIQIDEEVVVKNKRKPAVKLIDRLLSDRGLRRLRREAPQHLKFKGKGHEKQDLVRLLNYYRLWMHDVFPKARFRDCIRMTEKEGHQAQLRVMRKQWIDETKPRQVVQPDEELDLDGLEVLQSMEMEQTVRQESVADHVVDNDEPLFVEDLSDFDMDEILVGTQKQSETRTSESGTDEVVAGETGKNESGKSVERDEFEDEMDAMNDLDDFF